MKLALFTTVYPGVEPFLADWLRSVRDQTDGDVRLWIGVDGLAVAAVCDAMGGDPGARWVHARPGQSPVQLRQRVWREILPTCEGIVMVDSDDILAPTRIAAARRALDRCDLAACALRLVDAGGRPLGPVLGARSAAEAAGLLPRHNVFGLSNTAFRCSLLQRCLPLPSGLAVADWYLATLAWLGGARLDFDPEARMDYRQHPHNMTQVLGPFTADRVARDTDLVRGHLELVQAGMGPEHAEDRKRQIAALAADVALFAERVVGDRRSLAAYVEALAALDLPPVWWISVAHPALAGRWRPEGD